MGRSRFLGAVLVGLGAFSAGVQLAWWWQAPPESAAVWLGALAWLLSADALVWGWRRLPAGRLDCELGQWRWHSAGYPAGIDVAAPEVVLDLQALVLLRLRNPAGARWLLWADADSDPTRWLDLRRALFAQPHLAGAAAAAAPHPP